MIFRSNSIFKNMCSTFPARSEKFIGSFPPTRAAILWINSYFSYKSVLPTKHWVFVGFFVPTGKFFICTVCNSYFLLPVTILNRKANVGYWSVAKNTEHDEHRAW